MNAYQKDRMPLYVGKKKIHALKIATVTHVGEATTTDESPIVELTFVNPGFPPDRVICRGKPTPGNGWYMVFYEDGYTSFSPVEAFEQGYKLMDQVIVDAARAAHEANRVLCLALGDTSQPKWDDAPDWQKLSAMQGVQLILDHPETTPEQSHESWLKVKEDTGWKYGPVKDPEKKEHPCFIPYGELPANQRLKDEMFGLVVRAVLGL